MSYFDHVECPNCGAKFHPESIVSRPAVGMACPHCAGPLEMKSLFGIADPFVEGGDKQTWSLDDLSPDSKDRPDWTGPGGYAPDPLKGKLPLGAKQRKKRPAQAAAPAREAVPWDKGRGEVIRAGEEDEEGVSALEAMRRMKDQG